MTLTILSGPGRHAVIWAVSVLYPGSQAGTATDHNSLMLERNPVFDIPSAMVRLARPPSWSPALIGPTASQSAVYVSRTRLATATTGECETFYDTIDLTAVRHNDFRLVGFDVEGVPMPGYALQTPAEGLAIDAAPGGMPTYDLYRAGQIRIRPPVFVNTTRRIACLSRYRVSMTLEGPHGADPFAGLRLPTNVGTARSQ